MYKKLGFAKYDGNIIFNIVCDNKDGTVDLHIDDIQGDITVCYVDKHKIELVEESEYIYMINKLKNS